MKDIYSFYCVGLECETEAEAWESFKSDARDNFSWINGYKYWRTSPEVQSKTDFDQGKALYVVKARVLAAREKVEGLKEAVIDGPYPMNFEFPDSITGFGLAGDKQ